MPLSRRRSANLLCYLRSDFSTRRRSSAVSCKASHKKLVTKAYRVSFSPNILVHSASCFLQGLSFTDFRFSDSLSLQVFVVGYCSPILLHFGVSLLKKSWLTISIVFPGWLKCSFVCSDVMGFSCLARLAVFTQRVVDTAL